MALVRSELRAFPRFACSLDGAIRIEDFEEPGQVMDLSRGGCKMLPFVLDRMVSACVRPGTIVTLVIAGLERPAKMVWSTANASAVGLAFVEPLSEADMEIILASRAQGFTASQ